LGRRLTKSPGLGETSDLPGAPSLPPKGNGAPSQYGDLARRMGIGDSVLLSKASALSLGNALKRLGYKTASRSIGAKFCVWKLELREIGNGRDEAKRPDEIVEGRRATA
jgi:hypothetical protein